ncbi:MAG: guanylate kinase [Candidatus Omnitrophica bacterium]|nr:guanylate kinase [Candidatus Omnitrophota bacterium]
MVSGPSGSGKTTLRELLLKSKKLKGKLTKSVSFTTRPKRSGERQGEGYFFLSEQEFKERLRAKKILEWTKYLGYYYGTPRDRLREKLSAGRHLVLCLDLKGASRIKRLYPRNTVTIFILPPSVDALKNRIAGRCSKVKNREIARRLQLARKEVQAAHKYDYSVVNEHLASAVRELEDIVLKEGEN